MYLAQNLRYLREQKGFNQKELSDVLGMSQAAIGNWESGSRTPEIETIIELAKLFDVTIDEIVLKNLVPPTPRYASNLKFLRNKYGMKQEDIGKLLGVGQREVSKYEKGEREISVVKLMILADFFGLTMDQLIKQDLSMEDGNGKTK